MSSMTIKRSSLRRLGRVAGCGFLLAIGAGLAPAAVVEAVQGQAGYSQDGASYSPLKRGMTLPEGALLRTGRGAAVEISLAEPFGRMRLTQNTILRLRAPDASAGGETELKLELEEGIVVGFRNQVGRPSRFQIKTPGGLVGLAASQYRVDARGYLVALDGLMILAHGTGDGSGKIDTQVLKAPPAVFHAPGYGVQPAPQRLTQEVLTQITAPVEGDGGAIFRKSKPPAAKPADNPPGFFDIPGGPQARPRRRI